MKKQYPFPPPHPFLLQALGQALQRIVDDPNEAWANKITDLYTEMVPSPANLETEISHWRNYRHKAKEAEDIQLRITRELLLVAQGRYATKTSHSALRKVSYWFSKHRDDNLERLLDAYILELQTIQESVGESPGGRTTSTILNLIRMYRRHQVSGGLEWPIKWRESNHSHYDINWSPPDEPTVIRRARAVLSKHYPGYASDDLQVPWHTTGSDVLRVGSTPPIFLKIFRRQEGAAPPPLRIISDIDRRLADSDAFDEQWREYLRPIITSGNHSFVLDEESWAIAYNFVDDARTGAVRHFAGKNTQEISSTALRIATVNREIANMSIPNNHTREDASFNEMRASLARLMARDTNTKSRFIAGRHRQIVVNAIDQLPHERIGDRASIHDVHPHNIFVEEPSQSCVLLFDFEAAGSRWPVVASVGSAMHRLVREYVRKKLFGRFEFDDDGEERTAITEGIEAFLNGYKNIDRQLPDELLTEGVSWAKATVVAKCLAILDYEAGDHIDPRARDAATWHSELLKFIAYLLELETFQTAVDQLRKCR